MLIFAAGVHAVVEQGVSGNLVRIGWAFSNRQLVAHQKTIGLFVTPLVLCVELPATPTVVGTMNACKQAFNEIYRLLPLPLGRVLQLAEGLNIAGGPRLPFSLLVNCHYSSSAPKFTGMRVIAVPSATPANSPITLYVECGTESVCLTASFQKGLYDDGMIHDFLLSVVANCRAAVTT
jgi:hypothetical protein